MFSKHLPIPITCIMLTFAHRPAHAQNSPDRGLTISAGGAYEQSVFDNGVTLALAAPEVPCGCTRDVDDPISGYAIRAAATYPLDSRFDIGARVELAHTSWLSLHEQPDAAVMLEGSGGIPINQTTATRETFTMNTNRLDLLARYTIPFGLSIEAGATLSNRQFVQARRTLELWEPENARFRNPDNLPSENKGRTLVFYDGTWPEAKHFTAGAELGISYAIPVIEGFGLVPEIMLRKEFTPPSENSEWPSFFASAGMSASYTF